MMDVVKYTQIKSAETCVYDGISLGEVMLRLDPRDVPTARDFTRPLLSDWP